MSDNHLTDNEGQLLIKIARDNITSYLTGVNYVPVKDLPEIFQCTGYTRIQYRRSLY